MSSRRPESSRLLTCPALASTTKVSDSRLWSECDAELLSDHPTVFVPYLASPESDTLDGIGRGEPEETSSELLLAQR